MLFLDADQQVFEAPLTDTKCPKCGHEKTVSRQFLHFFKFAFVPCFAVGQSQSLYCYRCCRSSSLSTTKSSLPLLAWLSKYIGLVLLIIVAGFYVHHLQQEQLKQEQYLLNPIRGDVYFVDQSLFEAEQVHQPRYQIFQVTEVDSHQIVLKQGNYTYLKKNQLVKAIRLDNLMLDSYFNTQPVVVSSPELQQLKESGAIFEVHRPVNLSLFGGIVLRPKAPKKFRVELPNPNNLEAIRLYQLGELKAAFEMFLATAEQGDDWAQYNLAQMYRDGEGTSKNELAAMNWFLQAAQQDHRKAKLQYLILCKKLNLCEKSLL